MNKKDKLKWLWHRIAYWGDKLLTLVFYLLVGLFILGYRFINMVRIKAWNTFLFVTRGIKSAWKDWRMGRRIKNDFKNYGIRQRMSEDFAEDWDEDL